MYGTSFRLERSKVPPMAFSSVEDLNKMKSRTLSVILRTKRNVNKNEYGRAEKFMARLRAEQGEKEGRRGRNERKSDSPPTN